MPRSNAFSATIRPLGRRPDVFGDFYHFVLELAWWQFLSLSALVFVALNTVFAALYVQRPASIHGLEEIAYDPFLHAFFFSVQTMSTIGYGGMSPATLYADVLVTIEAAIGMLFTALVTGLTFARLARPRARVLFSEKMVIVPRDGVPHLQFRMANWRHNVIVEARLKAYLLCEERTREGEVIRRPVPLELVRGETAFFWMSWLAMHRIDERSPLHGSGALTKMRDEDAIIMLSLVGTDETVAQTVHAGYRYAIDDIVVGARFRDIMSRPSLDEMTIDYRQFHRTLPLARNWWTPELEAMARELGQDVAPE